MMTVKTKGIYTLTLEHKNKHTFVHTYYIRTCT